MKKHEKWMPLYIGDYLAATRRLSLAQHGAYLLLIMDYWRNGAPPDNPELLARIVGASQQEWAVISRDVRAYFTPHDGKLYHSRLEAELAHAIETGKRLSARGKLGAATRWDATSNATSIQLAIPNDMLVDGTSPSPSPLLQPSPSTTSKALASSDPLNGQPVALIPLVGGTEWGVSSEYLKELEAAYPQVDGVATLREMRVWCISNPTKCKTKRGVKRFINRWFEKEQNHG